MTREKFWDRLKQQLARPWAAGSEPVEMHRAVLEDIASQVVAVGGGRRVFPFDRVEVKLLAETPEEQDRLEAVVHAGWELEREVAERLRSLGVRVPPGLAVPVAVSTEASPDFAGRRYTLAFRNTAAGRAPVLPQDDRPAMPPVAPPAPAGGVGIAAGAAGAETAGGAGNAEGAGSVGAGGASDTRPTGASGTASAPAPGSSAEAPTAAAPSAAASASASGAAQGAPSAAAPAAAFQAATGRQGGGGAAPGAAASPAMAGPGLASPVAPLPRAGSGGVLPTLRLAVLKGRAVRDSYELAAERVYLGRLEEVLDASGRVRRRNDVAFLEEGDLNETVSREHARIAWDADSQSFWLRDEGSAAGTLIFRTGRSIEVSRHDRRGVRLQDGDEVYLGRAAVRVELPGLRR